MTAPAWTAEAFADAVRRAEALGAAELAAAQRHAATFTWDRTARDTRAQLEQVAGGRP